MGKVGRRYASARRGGVPACLVRGLLGGDGGG